MTDGQIALKAAKVAALVLGGLFAFGAMIYGVAALLFWLLGPLGAALAYLCMIFLIFWLTAAIDITKNDGREDKA